MDVLGTSVIASVAGSPGQAKRIAKQQRKGTADRAAVVDTFEHALDEPVEAVEPASETDPPRETKPGVDAPADPSAQLHLDITA